MPTEPSHTKSLVSLLIFQAKRKKLKITESFFKLRMDLQSRKILVRESRDHLLEREETAMTLIMLQKKLLMNHLLARRLKNVWRKPRELDKLDMVSSQRSLNSCKIR